MKIALMIILAIAAVVLIVSVMFQSSEKTGLSGAIGGGAEQLFGRKKTRGYEAVFRKVTIVCAVLFMVLALVLVMLE